MDLLAEANEDLQDEMDEGEEEGVERREQLVEEETGQGEASEEAEEDVRLPFFGGPRTAGCVVGSEGGRGREGGGIHPNEDTKDVKHKLSLRRRVRRALS